VVEWRLVVGGLWWAGVGGGEADVWVPRVVVGIKEKYKGAFVRE
jgi:hypothetical protein